MAQFIKKTIVEARPYQGSDLHIVNDEQGELVAHEGDYLVGSERGKISVVAKADFERDYVSFTPTSDDDEINAAKASAEKAEQEAAHLLEQLEASDKRASDALAELAKAQATQNDLDAAQKEVADLKATLEESEQQRTAVQAHLDQILAIEKQAHDAQAALDAAEEAKSKL